jgi:hypothetical protein
MSAASIRKDEKNRIVITIRPENWPEDALIESPPEDGTVEEKKAWVEEFIRLLAEGVGREESELGVESATFYRTGNESNAPQREA